MASSLRSLRVATRAASQISSTRIAATATRSLLISTRASIIRSSSSSSPLVLASPRFVRHYSSPSNAQPEDLFGSDEDPNSPIAKIKNSPEVLKVLIEIGEMLQAKGYVVPGQAVGMWTMMKMLKDTDFQAKLLERKYLTAAAQHFIC